MLTPKTFTLQGIGRFVTKQTIDFDQLGQLVQVDGQNLNTGGSSGSGKTTIFNAMDYNLGINDLPTTVLQSRLTKDGIYTEGLYDWDGKEVIIIRGKGKFSVSIDGSLVEGSAKLVEEKIDEIMGMSRDLFRPIFHKRQKEGGFFLSMTPSEVHEFLTNVLNLEDYAKKLEIVDKDIKELAINKEKLLIDQKVLTSGLKATQDGILGLGLAPVRDMHQSVVLDLKAKSETSNANLQIVLEKHNAQNVMLDSQRPIQKVVQPLPLPAFDNLPFDHTRRKEAEDKRAVLENQLSQILELEKNRQLKVKNDIQHQKDLARAAGYRAVGRAKAEEEVKKLTEEVKKLRSCLCPTCEQQWVTDSAKVKEQENLQKIINLRKEINEGLEAEKAVILAENEAKELEKQLIPYYDPQLPLINEEISAQAAIILEEKAKFDAFQSTQSAENGKLLAAYHAENNRLQSEAAAINKAANDEFAKKQMDLRLDQNNELSQVRGQAEIDRRAFEAAANKLKSFEEANTRYQSSLANLKAQEQGYEQKLVDINQKMVTTDAKLIIAEETKRAIKSFMSCSFDEALDEIGDAATRTIRSIPNMANATIQFQGLRETNNGKIKEEVNAVISMDGEEGIDIRSLSGGEGSSADLAVDLAVVDLIENRSNKGISLFILDEPFTGLDTVSIEMVLELLKNAKINKKLILVDHNPEVKEMVENRIIAVREGLTSTIIQ